MWLGLAYNDKETHTRELKKRTESFLKCGFLEEVESLLSKYGELDLFKRTIGYAQAVHYFKNGMKKHELVDNITLRTKQFAKRQMTWFRANKDIHWIYLDNKNVNHDKTFKEIEKDII